MPRTRITTLFLDAGGVLVFPNWPVISDALRRHGVDVPPERLEAADPATKRQLDVAPTVNATNDDQRGFLYFDLILKYSGILPNAATDAALAQLRDYHVRDGLWDYVPADVIPQLRRLRAAGLRLVVVSNTNGTLRRMFDRVGLLPHVDVVIDSAEEGIEKPDPRLFVRALERSGASRETTIHTGDLYEIDIVGARAAGLKAVLIDAAELYEGVDCTRVRSLSEFADRLLAGEFD
jgi:HAD superfamily hydrolase (TIGR01549 family)